MAQGTSADKPETNISADHVLAQGLLDLHEHLHMARNRSSLYLFAGSAAFVFKIVSDVEAMFNTYGKWPIKVALVGFMLSLSAGIVSLLLDTILFSVSKGSRLQTLFAEFQDLQKKPTLANAGNRFKALFIDSKWFAGQCALFLFGTGIIVFEVLILV
jgi:hypothetical protein